MKYPKEVMRLNELVTMGFDKEWLLSIARKTNNNVAWRNIYKRTSPWYFSTEELEKVRKAACVGR